MISTILYIAAAIVFGFDMIGTTSSIKLLSLGLMLIASGLAVAGLPIVIGHYPR